MIHPVHNNDTIALMPMAKTLLTPSLGEHIVMAVFLRFLSDTDVESVDA